MGFFSRWLKKSPVSVAQKFSESPVNISQVTQLPIVGAIDGKTERSPWHDTLPILLLAALRWPAQ